MMPLWPARDGFKEVDGIGEGALLPRLLLIQTAKVLETARLGDFHRTVACSDVSRETRERAVMFLAAGG